MTRREVAYAVRAVETLTAYGLDLRFVAERRISPIQTTWTSFVVEHGLLFQHVSLGPKAHFEASLSATERLIAELARRGSWRWNP